MSEWLRRQIQDLLRKLMGSNPIPRKQFGSSVKRTWWRSHYWLLSDRTGLAQSVERRPFKPNVAGSSPAIGIRVGGLFKNHFFNV